MRAWWLLEGCPPDVEREGVVLQDGTYRLVAIPPRLTHAMVTTHWHIKISEWHMENKISTEVESKMSTGLKEA